MALVDYSSSSDDEPGKQDSTNAARAASPSSDTAPNISVAPSLSGSVSSSHVSNKRRRKSRFDQPPENLKKPIDPTLPPLPDEFYDLYTTEPRASTSDDPSLHGGRKRAVPHIEGNWPAHVYLEWNPTGAELDTLNEMIDLVKPAFTTTERSDESRGGTKTKCHLHSLLYSKTGGALPLHISLSAPLILRTEQREDFLKELQTAIANIPEQSAALNEGPPQLKLRAFELHLTSACWVSNESRTRHFLVLSTVNPENNALDKLLSACNAVAARFGQRQLYMDKAHATVDSILDVSDESEPFTPLSEDHNMAQDAEGTEMHKAPDDSETAQTEPSGCFHFSIAWTLQDPSQSRGRGMYAFDEMPELLDDVTAMMGNRPMPECKAVKIKIGNKVHSVRLEKQNWKVGSTAFHE